MAKIGENCGTCDFCIERKKWQSAPQKDIVKISVFSLALEAVLNLNERFGITMISKILHGNSDKKILENHLDEEENFGVLASYSTETISAILETLIIKNFLYKTEGNYPTLGITLLGRKAIRDNSLLEKENTELQFSLEKKISTQKIFTKKPEKSEKIAKIPTIMQTLELWNIHKNIPGITKIRELTTQTVESHLVELYKQNSLSLQEILGLANFEHLKILKNFLEKNPNAQASLSEIKNGLSAE